MPSPPPIDRAHELITQLKAEMLNIMDGAP